MAQRYPKNIVTALNHVWLCKESVANATSNEPDALVLVNIKQLVDDVIFRETDQSGRHRLHSSKHVSQPIQELELLTVLLDYFGGACGNNHLKRNTLFMTLFPPVQSDRLRLLSKLVCMAIFTRNVPVLGAACIWIQELGCTSEFSAKLADDIYLDFFVLVSNPLECLKDLPTLSPHFTANLVATFTERFGIDKGDTFEPPPACLLEVITLWISRNPMLCMTALTANVQILLPRGINIKPAMSPFGGLIRWCVLTPLFFAKIEKGDDESEVSTNYVDFSKLHLALVQSAAECHIREQKNNFKQVVCAQQLCNIVDSMCLWVKKTTVLKCRQDKALTCALHRFGQVVHMLLAGALVSGNVEELVSKMKKLPPNRLIQIILDKVNNYRLPETHRDGNI